MTARTRGRQLRPWQAVQVPDDSPRAIDAARVLTPSGWTGPARVIVDDDGMIGAIEPLASTPTGEETWLVPGFVDLQVNGIDDVDVATADGTDWDRLDSLVSAQGVTTWCPTLVSMPLDRYDAPLHRIAAAMRRPHSSRPSIAGVHLEGPFLGDAPGAHPRRHLIPADSDWIDALPAHVALMTVAPEREGVLAAIEHLVGRGICVAIGHTRCTESEFDTAVASGASLVTHVFNGMSGVHHREPGVAAFALTSDDTRCSLIADGVHVSPRVIRLTFTALGADRAVLVTDAVAWRAGTVSGIGIEFRDGAPRLPDGTLAGSALTMDAAIRHCVLAGVPLEHAVRAASTNPAAVLGLDDRGRIEAGCRADLVALTTDLRVASTWVAGRQA